MSENHGYICVGECQHFIDKKNEVLAIQRDNEALRKEVANWISLDSQLAATEAKCERLKEYCCHTEDCRISPKHECDCGYDNIRTELPSTSLTNYIREQTKEVASGFQTDTPWPISCVLDMLKQGVEHLLHIHNCDHIGHENLGQAVKQADLLLPKLIKALAKLKEIRGEK